MRLSLIGILAVAVVAMSSATAFARPHRTFAVCHRSLHVAGGDSGNPFLETAIAVDRMSCARAYRSIRHLPAALLLGTVTHERTHGYRCVVRGSGQPSETVCTGRVSAYRFQSYSD